MKRPGSCGAGLCLALGVGLASIGAQAQPAPAQATRPDERLIDQFGHRVAQAELSSHWLLVYFGYADCPQLCPAALTHMRLLLQALGTDGDRIQPIFVSVDPRRDTPEHLRAFAARFHPRLRALTGSEPALQDAARTFGVPVKADGGGGFDHGVLLYLAAPGGQVVRILHPDQPLSANLAQVRAALGAQDLR